MADYDDDDFYDFGSLPVANQQEFLYDQIGFAGNPRDTHARELFWDIMYNDDISPNQRIDMYEEFVTYIWNEYGINFTEVWDWQAFRDWYEYAGT